MLKTYNTMQYNDDWEINVPQKIWDVLVAWEDNLFNEEMWK